MCRSKSLLLFDNSFLEDDGQSSVDAKRILLSIDIELQAPSVKLGYLPSKKIVNDNSGSNMIKLNLITSLNFNRKL